MNEDIKALVLKIDELIKQNQELMTIILEQPKEKSYVWPKHRNNNDHSLFRSNFDKRCRKCGGEMKSPMVSWMGGKGPPARCERCDLAPFY